MENVLEVRGLRKHYKGFALKDVSFSLPRGYVMGLIYRYMKAKHRRNLEKLVGFLESIPE